MIPYGRQDITQADIDAVADVLRSDFLTQGPQVPLFEQKLAALTGAAHVVAVNSATSALHIACLALGLGKGDWLWTSPITFAASANCALYCGAQVDFVDIDPATYNMSVEALSRKLAEAERDGRLPKIVVPVHLAGQPCEMEVIHSLGQRYGFSIIEDASHAIGAQYRGEPVGNCRYSDVTVFSFHPVKIVTTAEGGAALTNRADLSERMGLLRSHGISRDPAQMMNAPEGAWYYEQIDLGFNYRMTDVQAALGVSQLDRLGVYVARRQEIADRYDVLLRDLAVLTPQNRESSSLHLYVVRLDPTRTGKRRAEVFGGMRERGIGVNVHYIPVHLHPYYRQFGFNSGDFPEAERYYAEAMSLPMHPGLTEADLSKVAQALEASLSL